MNAYPIGNDLTVKWSLLYSDGSVFPLSNYDYELSYRTNRGNKVVTDTSVISVDENILTWTFKGDEQVVSGRYTICLKITLSGSKVVELQYDNAFMLSPLSGFKGAGSEIVLQSYCDAIDLKDAVLQARKAMDIAANALVDTANSARDAKAAKAAAEVTAAQAKADAESAKTMAADAKDKVAVAEKAATDASRDAVAAQRAAQTASDHITSLQQAIAELPDGQAVTEKVAEHTIKLTELEGKTTEILSITTQDNDDAIIITDNEDNVVATINKDECDFKNLKSNGVPVEAIPEILHDETIGGESEQTWESNDGTEVYAKINEHGLSAKVFLDVPEFVVPSVVEPDDSIVDSGYSSPIGRANVKRADWSATDKYLYYDFLAHYYDGYINETSSYKVTKRSLGSDASNMGYELFEYDFRPAKYSKVVMLSAGMNTCETGGIWGLATFIKAMMTSNEAGFKFLRENVRFKVLPIICPASFDQATLKYENYNGVAINRNFDYKRSFYDVVWPTKGEYPDSENETRILKKWINDNAWRADLYIDCHQDPDAGADKGDVLSYVICSDSDTTSRINGCMSALVNYYKDKGTIPVSVTPKASAWTEGGNVYPKTKYCKDICGIRALIIEQYCASTMYGSDGATINDTFQIKQYVAVLRLYIFAALAGNKAIKSLGELGNFIK